jgi:hypothetical protein
MTDYAGTTALLLGLVDAAAPMPAPTPAPASAPTPAAAPGPAPAPAQSHRPRHPRRHRHKPQPAHKPAPDSFEHEPDGLDAMPTVQPGERAKVLRIRL